MDSQSDPPSFVPVEQDALLKDGMTGEEVRTVLAPRVQYLASRCRN